MPMISTVFNEDPNSKMLQLQFLVDNVVLTEYTYKDGQVTMNERNLNHLNTYKTFVEGLQTVKQWIEKIWDMDKDYLTNNKCLNNYKLTTFLNSKGLLVSQYKVSQQKIIKSSYDGSTKIIKFWPRNKIAIHFWDFKNLYLYQRGLISFYNIMHEINEIIDTDLEDL